MASEADETKGEIGADPATWTALEEKIFIQLMVKEVHKGNRSATTFSRKGWKSIEQEFSSRSNKRYNNCQLRNKFNQLRTRYHDFTKLLQEPGINWDPVLNTVSAPENVWELYLKESNLNIEESSTNATPSAFPDETGDDRDYTSQNTQCQRSPTPASHHGGRREVRTVEIIESSREWTEVSKPLAPTLTRLEASPQSCAFSITNCVKCLESIEGVDEITYIKAIKMFKDVDWREMFMAMSAERRLVWLASLE